MAQAMFVSAWQKTCRGRGGILIRPLLEVGSDFCPKTLNPLPHHVVVLLGPNSNVLVLYQGVIKNGSFPGLFR